LVEYRAPHRGFYQLAFAVYHAAYFDFGVQANHAVVQGQLGLGFVAEDFAFARLAFFHQGQVIDA
jgi:hypothetical protein